MKTSTGSSMSLNSASRRVRFGLGLTAAAVVAAACVPEPSTPTTTTTTTTTTEATTTTTEATTTTAAPTTTIPVPTPTLVVSKTAGLNSDGETVTITGSGYNPNASIGNRPPASGLPTGVYVVFGKQADTWAPSAGAPGTNRQVITQKWVAPQSTINSILTAFPSQDPTQFVPMQADGSFSFDVEVETSTVGTNAYGIVSYAAGTSVPYAPHELRVPVTFAPKITSDLVGTPTEGQSIVVKGVGFLPSAVGTRPPLSGQPAGAYVVWGRFADTWRPSAGAPSTARTVGSQVWALPLAAHTAQNPTGDNPSYTLINADGSFTVTLTAGTITSANANYGIYTYPGSGAANAAQELSILSTAPVAAPAQIPA